VRTLALLLAASCSGLAGTITSGISTYTTGALPASQTGNGPTADLRPLGGTATDHLVRNWWYYRVQGDSRERPFGNYTKSGGGTVTTTEVSTGNKSTFTITERAANNSVRFNAVLAYTLSSGPSGSWALLEMALRVTNPTAVPLTVAFFNYLDADIAGSANNDSATLHKPDVIRITDPGGQVFYHSAVNPNAYRVTAANTLRTALLDASVTNLNNTGLPFGAGNYTGAWQWNATIAPGQSITLYSAFGNVEPVSVPEPETWAMVAAGAALICAAGIRRKARRRI